MRYHTHTHTSSDTLVVLLLYMCKYVIYILFIYIGCHFCESDNQCHAYGSAYGCTIGRTCIPPEDECFRASSQHIGYGVPSGWVIIGIVTLGMSISQSVLTVSMFLCLYVSMSVCNACNARISDK
jgi:hypothetical protein